MKHSLLVFFLLPVALCAQIISIEEARSYGLGDFVTVTGIVTADEFGSTRYFQDGTAGLAGFPGSGSNAFGWSDLEPGDSIRVSGQLSEFNGLLQIDPITNFSLLASDLPLPAPLTTFPDEWNDDLESLLVAVDCADLNESGTFGGNDLVEFTTPSGATGAIYIRNSSPVADTPIPEGTQRISGILVEFQGLFEILPRSTDDFEDSFCSFSLENIRQTDIQPNSFSIEWENSEALTGTVRYGTEEDNLDQIVEITNAVENPIVNLSGLDPATFYFVEIEVTDGSETLVSPMQTYITQSLSSMELEVYFNGAIQTSVSNGSVPAASSVAVTEARLLDLIDHAQETIDVMAYNTTRSSFVNALKAAHNRGVRVRYVRDDETGNQGLNPPPPFPVLIGAPGDNLMHNKFLVVDVASVENSYVWTGSMNFTNSNIAESFNNSILIQDQSLAKTYEREFEEMWGSDSENFDEANAKFGPAKRDNTPHYFNLNGIPVECYFSPSDPTTARIETALYTADSRIDAALLLLTRDEMTDAMLNKHNEGVAVRLLVDDTTNDFFFLQNSGVPAESFPEFGKFLHHKYAVVDADAPDSDPVVITGSHNWTNKAETSNDENTLLIYDADVANLFYQEFEARWTNFVSTRTIPAADFGLRFSENPTATGFGLTLPTEFSGSYPLVLTDLTGRSVLRTSVSSGDRVDVSELPAGLYHAMIRVEDVWIAELISVIR